MEQCPGDIPGGTCPGEAKDENGNYIYDTNGDGILSDSEKEIAKTEFIGIAPLPSPYPVPPGQEEQCPGDLPGGTCPSDKLFGKVNLPFGVPDILAGKCPGNEPNDEYGNYIPSANGSSLVDLFIKFDGGEPAPQQLVPTPEPEEIQSRWERFKALLSGPNSNQDGGQPQIEQSDKPKDSESNSRVYGLPVGWTERQRQGREQSPRREELPITPQFDDYRDDLEYEKSSPRFNDNGPVPIGGQDRWPGNTHGFRGDVPTNPPAGAYEEPYDNEYREIIW